jgi:hypothetical protein
MYYGDIYSSRDHLEMSKDEGKFKMAVRGLSWDETVYTGLCAFHKGKGFDPDSQDVARHLGYPLYRLSSELESPFAHGEPQSVFLDRC